MHIGTTKTCMLCPAVQCVTVIIRRRYRRLIVIVWRPQEHVSACSSKTVGDREKIKILVITCQARRELPLSTIAAVQ